MVEFDGRYLTEKDESQIYIIEKILLNKRSEIISHCHYQSKLKLKALASNIRLKNVNEGLYGTLST